MFSKVVCYGLGELATLISDWDTMSRDTALVWFQLPEGRKCQASKLDQLGTTLDYITNNSNGVGIICMLSHDKERTKFPLHRWKRIVEHWRPRTSVVCSCQVIPERVQTGIHSKYRVFATNCVMSPSDCSHPHTGYVWQSNFQKEMYTRMFLGEYLKVGVPTELSEDKVFDKFRSSSRTVHPGQKGKPRSRSADRRAPRASREAQLDLTCEHRAVLHRSALMHSIASGAQNLPDSAQGSAGADSAQGGLDHSRDSAHTKNVNLSGVSPDRSVTLPTDSKERQNEQRRKDKEAGIERTVVKRPKMVQDHHDDCGESLDSISTDLDADLVITDSSEDEDVITDDIQLTHFWKNWLPVYLENNLQYVRLDSWKHMFATLQAYGTGMDIAEVCGGEARTTKVGIRRRLRTGRNIDLVTGCDLRDKAVYADGLKYFKTNTVLVAVMAPACGPYGPLSHMNWHRYPDSMRKQEKDMRPVASFCGEVAIIQMDRSLHWLQEQPYPSDLYEVHPWPRALTYPHVCRIVYHRCACGLRVLSGPHRGKFIKKPSSMTASDMLLIEPFRGRVCTHHPDQHLNDIGHGEEHRDAQIWTWKESECIVQGIVNLRKILSKCNDLTYAFPEGESSVEVKPLKVKYDDIVEAKPGGDPNRSTMTWQEVRDIEGGCKACIANWAKDHWCHTRDIGKCRWPHTPPWKPTCTGCLNHPGQNKPSNGHDGTPGCWWEARGSRQPVKRFGRHPRDPARKASADATAPYRGAPKGKELGIEHEEDIARKIAEGRKTSASSTARPPPSDEPEGLPLQAARRGKSAGSGRHQVPTKSGDKEVEPSSDQVGGDGIDPDPDDWTHFDIKRVLRTLRMSTMDKARLTLRKLHLRWWHAPAEAMKKLLNRAGVPSAVTDYCDTVVQTCRACREWAKPQPENVANVDLPDHFNQEVEADLMFHDGYTVFHMIDRCTRWYMSVLVPNREDETLINALDKWVELHGPMTRLYMDQETAIQNSAVTTQYFTKKGIDYVPRAKGQQVPYIDRRGALMREIINKMVSQLKIEKIKMPFARVLSEATFCSNALLTVNNMSPYNAVYGRVPPILPGIDQVDADNEDLLEHPGLIRHTYRLREIAVEAMIQETAKARAQRALTSRTRPAGQAQEYKKGELVDFHRPPSSKDMSGWIGPAKVLDPDHMNHGTVTIKHLHRPFEVRLGDLRKHLPFLMEVCAFLSAYASLSHGWSEFRMKIQNSLAKGKSLLLGCHTREDGTRHLYQGTAEWLEFLRSASAVLSNMLSVAVSAVRIGRACARLQGVPGFDRCVTLFWYSGTDKLQRLYHSESNRVGCINFARIDELEWDKISFCQVFSREDNGESDLTRLSDPVKQSSDQGPDQPEVSRTGLEPIPEESTQDSSDGEDWFIDDRLHMEKAIKEANKYATYLSDTMSTSVGSTDTSPETSDVETDMLRDEYWHQSWNDSGSSFYLLDLPVPADVPECYHEISANMKADLPPTKWCEEDCIEIFYENHMHKILRLTPEDRVYPADDELVCETIYKASKHKGKVNKTAVVDRPDAVLTPEEVRTHWPEVVAAMKKELETWIDLQCICRKPRRQARNIIDVRWVHKRKFDAEVRDATSTGASKVRLVIRARLCLRGFKDVDAQGIEKYAGTASRHTQRVLVSEAVVRQWDLVTTDISKAFLQGVTYEELSKLTGEPLREVNFDLPPYCLPILKQLKGWEDFDPKHETIHCIKPGTGCNDAPRCFSLKLSKVTKDLCNMVPSTTDGELCMLHKSGELVALMAKHVDDLKVTGENDTVIWILQKIETVFGKMKLEWNNFTNCGVRHIQDKESKEVTLDQEEYISGIKLCVHPDISSKDSESLAEAALHEQYWSVLGAIAYAILTRPDIAVFIAALQRYTQTPKIIHVKRLNVVVRWAQRNPKKLVFPRLASDATPKGRATPTHLRLISDAAFKKEEDDGHSMRGAVYVRAAGNTQVDFTSSRKGHLLEYVSKQQRRVTRSTFTSELQGGCDTVDKGFLIVQTLHELQAGSCTAAQAMHLREQGGYAVPWALYLDALSVYAAITATFIKTPADNGVLIHCLYLRELLNKNILHALIWQDTRDMLADGLTKGQVDRAALHAAMTGWFPLEKNDTIKFWRPKHLLRDARAAET